MCQSINIEVHDVNTPDSIAKAQLVLALLISGLSVYLCSIPL